MKKMKQECGLEWGRGAVLGKVSREGPLQEVTVGLKPEFGPRTRQAKVLEQRRQQVQRPCVNQLGCCHN
jgi:hypothetical protein